MTARILALRGTEPVRLVLFPVLVIIVGYAVYRGIVDQSLATGLIGLAAVVLGVPAVEAARASVTPTAKVPGVVAGAAVSIAREAAKELQLAPENQRVVEAIATQIENYAGRHRATS